MIFIHPRHAWHALRIDRTGLWPVVIIGWWTVEWLPGPIGQRLVTMLAELRRKPDVS